ncbi:MAG: hypothetical protein KJN64_04920 [Ignavibacteria bacterium]|nr:hypothetical protein [Ignavibacteria bacterium]MBT8390997.1 hypothetical protein [Ignavibacteria bacterium]NNJ54068.1 hypothetical protein [Ignavibacteriaceae bacterium]
MKFNVKYFLFLSTLLFISCDDTITSEDINNIVMPDSNVSYAQHIAPVFEIKCVLCHRDERMEGGVNLSSYTNVVADPRIVFRGSDSTSVLVWTIEKLPPYAPMPPSEWLIRNHIDGIRTWIREGAENN